MQTQKLIIRLAEGYDVNRVYDLRFEVFVNEQNVPHDIEIDQEDSHAIHIIAEKDGEAVGCARLITGENDAHMGRLAVKKTFRGQGIGSDICLFIIDYCRKNEYTSIWLNSQLHAVGFYKSLGFKEEGSIFLDAGIEHIKMTLVL